MSSHFLSGHHASAHFESSHFGREPVIPVEEEPGSAWDRTDPGQREREDWYREQILAEDQEILELLTMFLHIMDD